MGFAGVHTCCRSRYGEFFSRARAYQFGVLVSGPWHALFSPSVGDIVTGSLRGWTFDPGKIAASVSTEENSGGRLLIHCSAAHGLVDRDLVALHRMNVTAHNKPTRVTRIDDVSFSCDDVPYSSGAGASTGRVVVPAHLTAEITGRGTYMAIFRINATAPSNAKMYKFAVFVEVTQALNTEQSRSTTGTLGELICNGLIQVVPGDRVWVAGANETNTEDIVVRNCNLSIVCH